MLPLKDALPSSSGEDSDSEESEDQADGVKYTLKLLEAWWDWLNDCHHVVDQYCVENADVYDWSVVEFVFGHLAKLCGVYGKDCKDFFKALQMQPHWVSHIQFEESDYLEVE
jgi:hypothetical protein